MFTTSVTWLDVVYSYKGISRAKTKEDEDRIKKIINDYYEGYKKCKK
jgi:hypothetical protein